MSNKVVRIGSSSSTKEQNEIVYSDISIVGRPKVKTQKYASHGHTSHGTSGIVSSYTISKSVNVRAVQNSLDNIFSWIPGERIINPEFGTKLHEYLYEGITQYNEEMIVAEIKSCIARWEPRVVVTQVVNTSTLSDTEDNTIVLDIKYYIKDLPDRIFDKQYIFNRSM